jgi:hypothetical protein
MCINTVVASGGLSALGGEKSGGCAAAGTLIAAYQLTVQQQGPDGSSASTGRQSHIGSIWYFVLLGGIAIAFALRLPRGISATIVDRFGVRPLPVGYGLSVPTKIRVGSQPEPAGQR